MKAKRMAIEMAKPRRARRKKPLAYSPIAVRMEQIKSAKYSCKGPSRWRIPSVNRLIHWLIRTDKTPNAMNNA